MVGDVLRAAVLERDVVEPFSACDLYGVTTASYLVEITVYDGGGGASSPALSFFMNAEPAACSAHAGQMTPSGGASGFFVPWLDGASPTMSSITSSLPRNFAT